MPAVAEWMAYDSLEPIGELRADVRAGIIASVIANTNRDRKRRPDPFTPHDFMPFLERSAAAPPTPMSLTESLKQMFGHPKAKRQKGR